MSEAKQRLILMADDDPDDQLLVQDALADCPAEEAQACRVAFVGDGEELLDRLLRRGKYHEGEWLRPDLILLDLNMPRKDGREALREIRSHARLRSIPIVIFTTSRAETDIEFAYRLGANSFITKPVSFEALVKTIEAVTRYWMGIVELPPVMGTGR